MHRHWTPQSAPARGKGRNGNRRSQQTFDVVPVGKPRTFRETLAGCRVVGLSITVIVPVLAFLAFMYGRQQSMLPFDVLSEIQFDSILELMDDVKGTEKFILSQAHKRLFPWESSRMRRQLWTSNTQLLVKGLLPPE